MTKTKIMRLLLITFALLVQSTFCYAQCPEAVTTCEKLLQGGLYSFTGMTNTGSFNQDLKTYYLSEQFRTDMKNGKWGGSLTIPIKGVPFTLGANDSEERFQQFKSSILSETTLNISSDYYQTTFASIPNTNLYEAFNQCIQTICNENQVGFLPVKELITEDYIVFTIHYRPQVTSDPLPKVQYFKVENALSVSNVPAKDQVLSQTTIISARRDPEKDIILTLQTDRGTVSRKIDGENSLSTNKELPIGTVITSFLTFEEFNFASKNNLKSPGEIWTSEKSKWAPCDGRSVANSGYSKVTSKAFTPDLRGQFIRGLNSFDPVKGPVLRNESERDPDNNRVVGGYQEDAFQGHKHFQVDHLMKSKNNDDLPNMPDKRPYWDNIPNSAGIYDAGFGKPRLAIETRPKNVAVYYYIKIN
jgi:hypothetical protein